LVRLATEKYTNAKSKIKKKYVHLTNYSVQKKAAGYNKNEEGEDESSGSKWTFAGFKEHCAANSIDYDKVFKRIHDVIIKTIISVEPTIAYNMNRSSRSKNICFELFGFDILLDKKLKPWLLEVNVSPSLGSGSALDKKVKTSLLCDTFNLVGFIPYNKK